MTHSASFAASSDLFEREIRELATQVVQCATEAHVQLAVAESCTGGLVSAALTSVSGSSAVVRGGVTSYAIEVKHDVLGVDNQIFSTVGAVSSECAQQMAQGVSQVLKADIAVSVTGIAGPTGAEPGKPIGTVWFGLCTPLTCKSFVKYFDGNRDAVRMQATRTALQSLLDEIAAC
ncbi:CinA family protein [Atopobium fossor]|uniref:CinA family protein n=1 Tax=Atopobium fossor TaxID=39487 RepID=UPI000427F218|nr:CinA family protein [Atopobium fossor]